MDLSRFYGYFVFTDCQSLVNWFSSYVPVVLLVVFVLNAVFSIFDYFIHMGGK